MARVTGEILINRPVALVFDYVADQRNEPIYNPRMLRSEKITDGPIGVGTRFRATTRSGRRVVEMLIEIGGWWRCSLRSPSTTGPGGSAHGPRCHLSMSMAGRPSSRLMERRG
jgi:hypothetical protein